MNYYSQNPPINVMQFKHLISELPDSLLEQLIKQAKQQGIPEKDIEDGLKFIQQIK